MAPHTFSRVEELFHAALARAQDERRAFLEEECRGDESLLREVESLLSHEEGARRFLGEPILDAATRRLTHSRGTRLGRYEIDDLIGRGGMGEVYRARDTVLARDVAIKVLPEGAAGDPDRLRRFEHEARAAGALNHPNILDVHDIGTHEGTLYVVTELLEGRTLRERLQAGAMPIPEVLSCAEQIADGLVAAHAKGIIHRDLKPANLFLTRDGRVKILDFGLAKLIPDPQRRASVRTPTQVTHLGDVLGTVAYMSPEQARGEELDVRTDLFSLGVVLYEIVAARLPFTGATSAVIFDAILHGVPTSPARLNPAVPARLEDIISKALEKDRDLRYQHASDLRADLKRLKRDSDSGRSTAHEAAERRPAVASPRSTLLAWTKRASGAAALVAVLGAVGWWLLSTRARDVPAAPVEITPFTTEGGLKRLPQLSPDGEKVAYMWAGPADDNWDIYVKALGPRTKPIRLTEHPADDQVPVWSPDGHLIAFRRVTDQGWAIYTVPALGGQERKLTDVGRSPEWGQNPQGPAPGLAWSPDGQWLALAEEPSKDEPVRIVRLDLATLHRQPLTSPPQGILGDAQLALSPDGRHLAFVRRLHVVDPGELWVQPTGGGEARRLVSADFCSMSPGYSGLAWTPDGSQVVFTAMTIAADRPRMFRVPRPGGVPQPVAGIGREARFPSIRGRRMVYEEWTLPPRDIWRIPGRNAIPGQAPEALIVSSTGDACPAFSPDDRRIAFASRRGGASNIFVCNSDGSNPMQLTDLTRETGMPRWSPDGRWIAFDSMAAGESDIYVIGAEGGLPRRLTPEPSVDYNPSWSRDGRWIYFSSDRGGTRQIWKIAADGGRAFQVTRKGGFDVAESWDGRYIYYSKDFRSGVWRMPVTGGEETAVVSGPLSFKGWALARGGVYFAEATSIGPRSQDYAIRYLDLESRQVSERFRKKGPFRYQSLAVSSDERWILHVEQPEPRSELMLVENFR
ncbi:MAG TPA: protein kinase [Vicinamibacteria bacterium]|nr:protein kinase [Vicinamibacteria bacterium]